MPPQMSSDEFFRNITPVPQDQIISSQNFFANLQAVGINPEEAARRYALMDAQQKNIGIVERVFDGEKGEHKYLDYTADSKYTTTFGETAHRLTGGEYAVHAGGGTDSEALEMWLGTNGREASGFEITHGNEDAKPFTEEDYQQRYSEDLEDLQRAYGPNAKMDYESYKKWAKTYALANAYKDAGAEADDRYGQAISTLQGEDKDRFFQALLQLTEGEEKERGYGSKMWERAKRGAESISDAVGGVSQLAYEKTPLERMREDTIATAEAIRTGYDPAKGEGFFSEGPLLAVEWGVPMLGGGATGKVARMVGLGQRGGQAAYWYSYSTGLINKDLEQTGMSLDERRAWAPIMAAPVAALEYLGFKGLSENPILKDAMRKGLRNEALNLTKAGLKLYGKGLAQESATEALQSVVETAGTILAGHVSDTATVDTQEELEGMLEEFKAIATGMPFLAAPSAAIHTRNTKKLYEQAKSKYRIDTAMGELGSEDGALLGMLVAEQGRQMERDAEGADVVFGMQPAQRDVPVTDVFTQLEELIESGDTSRLAFSKIHLPDGSRLSEWFGSKNKRVGFMDAMQRSRGEGMNILESAQSIFENREALRQRIKDEESASRQQQADLDASRRESLDRARDQDMHEFYRQRHVDEVEQQYYDAQEREEEEARGVHEALEAHRQEERELEEASRKEDIDQLDPKHPGYESPLQRKTREREQAEEASSGIVDNVLLAIDNEEYDKSRKIKSDQIKRELIDFLDPEGDVDRASRNNFPDTLDQIRKYIGTKTKEQRDEYKAIKKAAKSLRNKNERVAFIDQIRSRLMGAATTSGRQGKAIKRGMSVRMKDGQILDVAQKVSNKNFYVYDMDGELALINRNDVAEVIDPFERYDEERRDPEHPRTPPLNRITGHFSPKKMKKILMKLGHKPHSFAAMSRKGLAKKLQEEMDKNPELIREHFQEFQYRPKPFQGKPPKVKPEAEGPSGPEAVETPADPGPDTPTAPEVSPAPETTAETPEAETVIHKGRKREISKVDDVELEAIESETERRLESAKERFENTSSESARATAEQYESELKSIRTEIDKRRVSKGRKPIYKDGVLTPEGAVEKHTEGYKLEYRDGKVYDTELGKEVTAGEAKRTADIIGSDTDQLEGFRDEVEGVNAGVKLESIMQVMDKYDTSVTEDKEVFRSDVEDLMAKDAGATPRYAAEEVLKEWIDRKREIERDWNRLSDALFGEPVEEKAEEPVKEKKKDKPKKGRKGTTRKSDIAKAEKEEEKPDIKPDVGPLPEGQQYSISSDGSKNTNMAWNGVEGLVIFEDHVMAQDFIEGMSYIDQGNEATSERSLHVVDVGEYEGLLEGSDILNMSDPYDGEMYKNLIKKYKVNIVGLNTFQEVHEAVLDKITNETQRDHALEEITLELAYTQGIMVVRFPTDTGNVDVWIREDHIPEEVHPEDDVTEIKEEKEEVVEEVVAAEEVEEFSPRTGLDVTVIEGNYEGEQQGDYLAVTGTRPEMKRDAEGNAVETDRLDNVWRVEVTTPNETGGQTTRMFEFSSEELARAAAEKVKGLPRSKQVEALSAMKKKAEAAAQQKEEQVTEKEKPTPEKGKVGTTKKSGQKKKKATRRVSKDAPDPSSANPNLTRPVAYMISSANIENVDQISDFYGEKALRPILADGATVIPEFAYNPVFILEEGTQEIAGEEPVKRKYLVFRDGVTIRIEARKLIPRKALEGLSEGDLIRVDLRSFNIKHVDAVEVVREVVKSNGLSSTTKADKGKKLTAKDSSGNKVVISWADGKWTVKGVSGVMPHGLQEQIDNINWQTESDKEQKETFYIDEHYLKTEGELKEKKDKRNEATKELGKRLAKTKVDEKYTQGIEISRSGVFDVSIYKQIQRKAKSLHSGKSRVWSNELIEDGDHLESISEDGLTIKLKGRDKPFKLFMGDKGFSYEFGQGLYVVRETSPDGKGKKKYVYKLYHKNLMLSLPGEYSTEKAVKEIGLALALAGYDGTDLTRVEDVNKYYDGAREVIDFVESGKGYELLEWQRDNILANIAPGTTPEEKAVEQQQEEEQLEKAARATTEEVIERDEEGRPVHVDYEYAERVTEDAGERSFLIYDSLILEEDKLGKRYVVGRSYYDHERVIRERVEESEKTPRKIEDMSLEDYGYENVMPEDILTTDSIIKRGGRVYRVTEVRRISENTYQAVATRFNVKTQKEAAGKPIEINFQTLAKSSKESSKTYVHMEVTDPKWKWSKEGKVYTTVGSDGVKYRISNPGYEKWTAAWEHPDDSMKRGNIGTAKTLGEAKALIQSHIESNMVEIGNVSGLAELDLFMQSEKNTPDVSPDALGISPGLLMAAPGIKKLISLFQKSKGLSKIRAIGKAIYTKLFTSGGIGRKEIIRSYEIGQGYAEEKLSEAYELITEWEKIAKKVFEVKNIKELSERQKAMLSKASRDPISLQKLPLELREPMEKIREMIDSLSKEYIEKNLLSDGLEIVFDENMGTYVARRYALWEDPEHYDKMMGTEEGRKIVERAMDAIISDDLKEQYRVALKKKIAEVYKRHTLREIELIRDQLPSSAAELDMHREAQRELERYRRALKKWIKEEEERTGIKVPKGYERAMIHKAKADFVEGKYGNEIKSSLKEMPRDRAQVKVQEIISPQRAEGAQSSSGTARMVQDNLIARKAIDRTFRELLGEIKNPGKNMLATIKAQVHALSRAKYHQEILNWIKEMQKQDEWIAVHENDIVDDATIPPDRLKEMSHTFGSEFTVLEGYRTDAETYRTITTMFARRKSGYRTWLGNQMQPEAETIMAAVMKMAVFAKMAKTVNSTLGMVRNFLEAGVRAILQGHLHAGRWRLAVGMSLAYRENGGKLAQYLLNPLQAIVTSMTKEEIEYDVKERLKQWVRYGIEIQGAEIQEIEKDLVDNWDMTPHDFALDALSDHNVYNSLLRSVNKAGDFMLNNRIQRISRANYARSDVLFKLLGCEAELRMLITREFELGNIDINDENAVSEDLMESLMREAVDRINNVTTTRARAYGFSQAASSLPLIASFPTFFAEKIRNAVETIKMIKKDMKSESKTMRQWAIYKSVGMAAGVGLFYGIAQAVSRLFFDDDELDELQQLVPDFHKNNVLMWFKTGDTVSYIDMSNTFSDLWFWQPLNAFARADAEDNAYFNFIQELTLPFAEEDLFFTRVLDVMRPGESMPYGTFNEMDPWHKRQMAKFAHMTYGHDFRGPLVPAHFDHFMRFVDATTGRTDSFGRKRNILFETFSTFVGARWHMMEGDVALKFKSMDFRNTLASIRQPLLMVAKDDKSSVSDMESALSDFRKRRENFYAQAKEAIRGAVNLGLTKSQARKILSDDGISDSDINYMMRGVARPYIPQGATKKEILKTQHGKEKLKLFYKK